MARKIVCKWKKSGQVLVNPDGQVWPCCYLASDQYGKPNKAKHPLLTKYHDNKDKYNLENDSIKKIINHLDIIYKDMMSIFKKK